MKKLAKSVSIAGLVVHGNKLGRTIDYPTANIKATQPFSLKPGVYLSISTIAKKNYLGLTYYGIQHLNPESVSNRLEIFIFDFNQNVYAQSIKLKLTHYLRAPQEVKNPSSLKKLIKKDLANLQNLTVLVNKKDQITGVEKILTAHLNPPQLHRAISVLIFNSKHELLLQKRSKHKPLWPLFWSNTCCGNKRPELSMLDFAQKRLKYEMGLSTKLKFLYKFTYQARYNQKLSEHEIDYVYLGVTDQKPTLNLKEAVDYKYISIPDLKKDIKLKSNKYTPWLKLILKRLKSSDILTT